MKIFLTKVYCCDIKIFEYTNTRLRPWKNNILYRKEADLLRTMAHPARIEITAMLLERKVCVPSRMHVVMAAEQILHKAGKL